MSQQQLMQLFGEAGNNQFHQLYNFEKFASNFLKS
jgi:hypothetical protein